RVGQTRAWLHERDALDFAEMTDLPEAERRALADRFELTAPALANVAISGDGTVKHLWRLGDGELIESVLIPAGDRLTLCISSQAGCAMACVFCATGWSGYRRQLTAAEIVAQYRGARRWAREHGRGPITNIVYMGMGEPLMNRPAVMRSLTLLNQAYGVGSRRITVSTVGVVPGLLAALRRFEAAGGRRITFEYVMIDGVNDALPLADELAVLAAEFGAHVNLIPYNPIPGNDWRPTPAPRLEAFAARLESKGV